MKFENYMTLEFPSKSCNEAFARSAVACFAAQLDPTLEEMGDIRTAVSEAVTNCIVHAYRDAPRSSPGNIYISARLYDTREVTVEISDNGCGIEDVALARTPAFTTGAPDERCGMGFLVMESFMDSLSVRSRVGRGTIVFMRKILKP